MPISGIRSTAASKTPSSAASKTTTPAGKTTTTSASNATAPRAPWLKDSGKTTATTQAPWSKRNATTTATTPAKADDKNNGTQKEVKLQSREIKVPITTVRKTSIPAEPVVKPKPKDVKVTVPEDEYETSSEEEEEETESEEEVTETESEEEVDDDDNKHKMPIQVKLKPVDKPAEVKKSPSVDRAGKFVKPTLKKVPTLDKLNKQPKPPPTIPESKPLRHVEKPLLPDEKDEKNFEFQRPPLRKADSITKKRKYMIFVMLVVLYSRQLTQHVQLYKNLFIFFFFLRSHAWSSRC